jgi:hypothetical protein
MQYLLFLLNNLSECNIVHTIILWHKLNILIWGIIVLPVSKQKALWCKKGRVFVCGTFIIPSPTKLRRDIVTLSSFRNILVNTLESTSFKIGTCLVLRRIWNPIDFQGQRSKVNVTGSTFYHILSL